MPMLSAIPGGSPKPIVSFAPGAPGANVLYASGTLLFDAGNNVVYLGDYPPVKHRRDMVEPAAVRHAYRSA